MIFKSPFPDVEIPKLPLTEFVFSRAQTLGDKPALIDGPSGRTLTYEGLYGAIRRVAASLAARGFKKGDVFAICSPNIPEYAIAFHAVATLGGIVTTANPLYTAHELNHQLTDAGASYLLTVPAFLEKAQEAAKDSKVDEIFVFGEADGATPFASLLEGDSEVPEVKIDPEKDLVVLPYSSGTTGLSKGVMLTHYNLVANISQLQGLTGHVCVREDDTLIGILPFYHIYGMVAVMNYALAQGATVVSMPRFDLEDFLKTMQEHKVTYAYLVPPIVLALSKHPMVDNYDLSALRQIISGAAPLGSNVAGDCRERLDCWVNQAYGMTEMSPVSHFNPDNPEEVDLASVGPVFPNTECKIVDIETDKDLGPGQRGELCVRGPQVMKGYLNNASATANTIDNDGWLHTGDVATVTENGYFEIVDRVKELIKYKGYQVPPAELEALLLSHPEISDAAVIGIPDNEAGEIPKAFVVKSGDVSQDDVMNFVKEKVSPQKQIRELEFIDEIPKSASGKILRRVLVDREQAA